MSDQALRAEPRPETHENEAEGAQHTVIARAKVNLALHVIGQRADGYHLLDSIVAFTDLSSGEGGDRLTVTLDESAAAPVMRVSGPFAGDVPQGPGNGAYEAACAAGGIGAIHLEKNIPVAAGLGGGSADTAAILRLCAKVQRRPLAEFSGTALSLGADVPVCLHGRSARMGGIGEVLDPIALPAAPALLVNPGVPISTPAVFAALTKRDNEPLPDWDTPRDPAALVAYLARTRNDLEPAAVSFAPVIGTVIEALGATGAMLSRVTGTGATVFALYENASVRDAAAAEIAAGARDWWVRPALIGGD